MRAPHSLDCRLCRIDAKEGLLPLNQHALQVIGDVAYHDYEGTGRNPEERARLLADLGDRHILVLRNHGLLTTGKTVGEAFVSAFYLEKACQFQVIAQSTGQPIVFPKEELQTGEGRLGGGDVAAWAPLLRKLDRLDPSYRD